MKSIVWVVAAVVIAAALAPLLQPSDGAPPQPSRVTADARAPDQEPGGAPRPDAARGSAPADGGAAAARAAFEARASNRMLHVDGEVERVLPDDREGSPHQRFIVRTADGLTLLLAHNLDLAPRLEGLQRGDRVRVYGEYEWNPQGGVIHWTHDDPRGVHPAGYIDWQGRRYQ